MTSLATVGSGAEPVFHVALIHPEIGPNTGNIGRLCLGIGARLHLVHPLGFSTGDKAVRRAGLDYWKHVDIIEHGDSQAFWTWASGRAVHLFSSHATQPYTATPYTTGDVLVFGRESVGLAPQLLDLHRAWCIPMNGVIRSLNLSNAVAVVAYQALQRVSPQRFSSDPGQIRPQLQVPRAAESPSEPPAATALSQDTP